jgi:hypothetical protein
MIRFVEIWPDHAQVTALAQQLGCAIADFGDRR